MMRLQDIQTEIESLSTEDYKLLSAWLKEHDFSRWDHQIEDDLNAGKFDALIAEARQDYQAGLTTPL